MSVIHWTLKALSHFLIVAFASYKSLVYTMRHATKWHSVNGLIFATWECCVVSQESWNRSISLRHHVIVACRKNRTVYTVRFTVQFTCVCYLCLCFKLFVFSSNMHNYHMCLSLGCFTYIYSGEKIVAWDVCWFLSPPWSICRVRKRK